MHLYIQCVEAGKDEIRFLIEDQWEDPSMGRLAWSDMVLLGISP